MGIYLGNGSWPDWDLLASIDQLKMTLWSIARSPIMYLPRTIINIFNVLPLLGLSRVALAARSRYSAKLPATSTELGFLTNPTAIKLNAEASTHATLYTRDNPALD